jgi:hypothetical protein
VIIGMHLRLINPAQIPIRHLGSSRAVLLADAAQLVELCRAEPRQHGDDACLGAVEPGEGLADARIDLLAVVLDVLADRGVDHVLRRRRLTVGTLSYYK